MDGTAYLIGVHGYENEERALVMAAALIREIRACPQAEGAVISGCE